MKRGKYLLALAMAGIMTLGLGVLAACGGGGGEDKITLTVWDDSKNGDMVEKLCQEFVSGYAGVYTKGKTLEINVVSQVEKSAVEEMGTQAPTGNGADVFAFTHDTLGTAVNTGIIAEATYADAIAATHTDAAVAAFSINNKVYGYPITAESITLIYDNTQLTEQQVKSFAGIKAAGKKIGMKMTSTDSAYYGFGLLSGADLFGENGTDKSRLNITDDKSMQMLSAFYTGYSDSIVDISPDECVSSLQNGTIAGIVTSPFMWDTVQSALGSKASIAVVPTVTVNGVETQTLPFSGYKGYGVSTYSENPYIAHALAYYLTNADSQYYRFRMKQLLPTLADTEKFDAEIAKDPEKYASVSVFKTALDHSRLMPNILSATYIWAPLQDAFTACWNLKGNATVDAVKAQMTTAQNTIKAKIG